MATESDEYSTAVFDNQIVRMKHLRPLTRELRSLAIGENTLKATKTGSMVSVDDAYVGHLLGLTVYGNSVQDDTPTPESPVPIKSVAGAKACVSTSNLMGLVPGTYTNGVLTVVVSDDGVVSITTSDANSSNVSVNVPYVAEITKRSDLHFHFRNSVADSRLICAGFSLSTANRITDNMDASNAVKNFVVRIGAGSAISTPWVLRPSLEFSSETTDWAPSKAHMTPLTLIDDQGVAHELRSVPEGTRDELILNADGSGTLVAKTKNKILNGSESWGVSSANASVFYCTLEGNLSYYPSSISINTYLLSRYNKVSKVNAEMANGDARTGHSSTERKQPLAYICLTDYTNDVDAFKSYLASNPVEVVWKTDDIQTYHIPAINMPSLPDLVSNAWVLATDADGAAIACECSIEYRRDINKIIGDIEEAIADIVSQ